MVTIRALTIVQVSVRMKKVNHAVKLQDRVMSMIKGRARLGDVTACRLEFGFSSPLTFPCISNQPTA